MSHFEKFKEELPCKEKFYSSLTNKRISDKEYEYVPNVWKKIEMKTMKDYNDLYLKCNILLLAVFEKFRNISLKNYGLCPIRYLSAAERMQCLKWQKMNLNLFQILTFIYSLREVQEMEFLIFTIDAGKATKNI